MNAGPKVERMKPQALCRAGAQGTCRDASRTKPTLRVGRDQIRTALKAVLRGLQRFLQAVGSHGSVLVARVSRAVRWPRAERTQERPVGPPVPEKAAGEGGRSGKPAWGALRLRADTAVGVTGLCFRGITTSTVPGAGSPGSPCLCLHPSGAGFVFRVLETLAPGVRLGLFWGSSTL